MLAEWIRYVTTPCPRHLRAMGYLHQAIAAQARHRRCRRAWAGHLEASRAAILAAAGRCRRRRRVTVLGSGALLDVPVEDLSALFAEVRLVDILHPPAARRRTRALANVTRVAADITGVARAVHEYAGGPLPAPAGGLAEGDADLVVSVNVLSQLALLPRDYLECRGVPAAESAAFAGAVVRHHVDALAGLDGAVCLVTDVERRVEGGEKGGESTDLLFGVTLPAPERQWTWDIAPRPEVHPDRDIRHRVSWITDLV